MPPIGYDGPLSLLALDEGAGTRDGDDLRSVLDAWAQLRTQRGATYGVVLDETRGADLARAAAGAGLVLAMPLEAPARDGLELAHGDAFAQHVESFHLDVAKVALRWHPADPADHKKAQAQQLVRVAAWLHETGRPLLVDLHVPPSADDLDAVAGDAERAADEVVPELTERVITEIHDLGIEADLWALAAGGDAAALASLVVSEGRDHVGILVAERDRDPEVLRRWMSQAAAEPAYRGVYVGRRSWGDASSAPNDDARGEDVAARTGEALARSVARFEDARGA